MFFKTNMLEIRKIAKHSASASHWSLVKIIGISTTVKFEIQNSFLFGHIFYPKNVWSTP